MLEREKVPTQSNIDDASRILFQDGPTIGELKKEKRNAKRLLLLLYSARGLEITTSVFRTHLPYPAYFKGLVEDQQKIAKQPYQEFAPRVEAKAKTTLTQAAKFGIK